MTTTMTIHAPNRAVSHLRRCGVLRPFVRRCQRPSIAARPPSNRKGSLQRQRSVDCRVAVGLSLNPSAGFMTFRWAVVTLPSALNAPVSRQDAASSKLFVIMRRCAAIVSIKRDGRERDRVGSTLCSANRRLRCRVSGTRRGSKTKLLRRGHPKIVGISLDESECDFPRTSINGSPRQAAEDVHISTPGRQGTLRAREIPNRFAG